MTETEQYTAENLTANRFLVDGVLLEPGNPAAVTESAAVRELADNDALQLTPKSTTPPKRGRASRRSPDGEE